LINLQKYGTFVKGELSKQQNIGVKTTKICFIVLFIIRKIYFCIVII